MWQAHALDKINMGESESLVPEIAGTSPLSAVCLNEHNMGMKAILNVILINNYGTVDIPQWERTFFECV